MKKIISNRLKATWFLRSFGFWKVPLIFYCRPSVIKFSTETIVIKVPYRRRNQNHLKSMYFGVLSVGADIAGGILAMDLIRRSGEKVSLIFKDFKADFLKRAEGDTLFTCNDGKAIQSLINKTITSGERVYMPVKITATVPSKFGDEPVAEFVLTLSLKLKS